MPFSFSVAIDSLYMQIVNPVKIILWNLGLIVLGAVILELLFGTWVRDDPLALLNLIRNGEWRYEIDYPQIAEEDRIVIYRRDNYGLRGSFGEPQDIDILTVGGSTTEQRYISEGKTWQDILQSKFNSHGKPLSIANTGLSGRTTFGHIRDFDYWFPMIPKLKPKYVLLYLGINDMFYDVPNGLSDQIKNATKENWRDLIKNNIKNHSAIYFLYRTAIGSYWAKKYNLTHEALDFINGTWVKKPHRTDYQTVLNKRLDGYRKRLYMLEQRIRKIGAIPIFVTQARGDYRFIKGELFGLVETRSRPGKVFFDATLGRLDQSNMNGVDHYLMLSLFNNVTMEVCKKLDALCVDLSNELHFKIGDFYDREHNTTQGAAKIGEFLFEKLKLVI